MRCFAYRSYVKLRFALQLKVISFHFYLGVDTNKNSTFHVGSGFHSGSASAAMAAAAASNPTTTFLDQYPGLFDPNRTSHLDWHLHAVNFHNAQGKSGIISFTEGKGLPFAFLPPH